MAGEEEQGRDTECKQQENGFNPTITTFTEGVWVSRPSTYLQNFNSLALPRPGSPTASSSQDLRRGCVLECCVAGCHHLLSSTPFQAVQWSRKADTEVSYNLYSFPNFHDSIGYDVFRCLCFCRFIPFDLFFYSFFNPLQPFATETCFVTETCLPRLGKKQR